VSKLIDYNQRLKYYTVNPTNKTTIFNGTKQTDTIFFRLTPKPNIQDLQVSIVPMIGARPGFNSSYKIIAKNVGTKIMYLPNVKFIKDSLQTFTDSLSYVFDGDTLFWQIDSLSLLEQREIIVSVLNAIPPTLNANDTLHLAAVIYPMENDSFVQDNYASLNQVVVNSVDPNDKIETHGGTIPNSAVQNREYLYYTIRFQNTGNSYASRIVITDTLTKNVDASTFEFLSSSIPFTMNVVDRKYITWTAANTYLPDSISDEANSHGYISFRIKPKAGLLPSDEITNRASIVFDYNAAISTNTCTTNIIEQRILSVKNNEIKSIQLFPNPTNGNVQLNLNLLQNKNYTLRVIDINGNLLSNETLKGYIGENNVSIDLSNYANGLYFIQISDETGNLFYGKVVKQ
ncbi:MAG TPA: T9SS type A sorting domain-containing protein, partial [Chitinophagales bacterium]|nr:T9SS type A sorting domain-containing protein [Chitinophagales bacterium]